MQGDRTAEADAAGEWLRNNITDPETQLSITWSVRSTPNPAALAWVLDTLFAPRPEDKAA